MKNINTNLKDYFKMSESDDKEAFHLQLKVDHRAIVGWKRYAAQFKNYNEAFESLAEVRINHPPVTMNLEKKD